MDTYSGNNEDPLSLHKYLYAQDGPVDGIDPSGNAIWFVERMFTSGIKRAGWYLNAGHGYLVFTSASDPGTEADPFTGGQQIAATFSWHPETWEYNGSQTPGRVWEDGPGDHPTGSVGTGYYPFLVTADSSAQAQVMTCIRNWIASDNSGYDFGPARPEPGNLSNDIGNPSEHREPPENSVYYSVMEENCVWWATIMLEQSKISVPQSVYNAIKAYNGGYGAAAQVINGTRSATTANTINPLAAEVMSAIQIPEAVGTSFTGF
jgi:hypothetical protein